MVKWWPNKLARSAGQTIVEVLIATGVVGVVLTAIAAGLSYSVKNSSDAKYRAFATSYAQDAIEVFRREKALLGWETFSENLTAGTYCLNDLPTNTAAFLALTPGSCATPTAQFGVDFNREAQVTLVNPTEIQVVVVVNWADFNRTPEVRVTQQFRPY